MVHTLQVKAGDGLKSFQIQSGLYRASINQRIKMAWEREREREIGESETNIFKPKRTIHLGSKVTLSLSGNS